jgi:hypothetical protein
MTMDQYVQSFNNKTLVLAVAMFVVALAPAAANAQAIWTIDRMFVKQGEFTDYLQYVRRNWLRARQEMQRRQGISGFHLLTREYRPGNWEVTLMTRYADSAAFANRETLFHAAVSAYRLPGAGPELVRGKGRPEMVDSVVSTVHMDSTKSPELPPSR